MEEKKYTQADLDRAVGKVKAAVKAVVKAVVVNDVLF
jgi:hypothetical protein